jgi:hypothetical protein
MTTPNQTPHNKAFRDKDSVDNSMTIGPRRTATVEATKYRHVDIKVIQVIVEQ